MHQQDKIKMKTYLIILKSNHLKTCISFEDEALTKFISSEADLRTFRNDFLLDYL
jgi:hypothetical protein